MGNVTAGLTGCVRSWWLLENGIYSMKHVDGLEGE